MISLKCLAWNRGELVTCIIKIPDEKTRRRKVRLDQELLKEILELIPKYPDTETLGIRILDFDSPWTD